MTDLVKIEKRKGRWVRAATGEPLTVDELHRCYYLTAILWGNSRFERGVEALSLSDAELGEFVRYIQEEIRGSCDFWLRGFAAWKAGRPPPTAADKARQRWKGPAKASENP